MSEKFRTTSSSLFTNQNVNNIPNWIENISEIQIKEKEKIDLEITPKASFIEKNTIQKSFEKGELRYLQGSKISNSKLVIDSKIQLAKFLLGKYYKTDASLNDTEVQLLTKIDGLPADFIFRFSEKNGKVSNHSTFAINYNDNINEYPFNKGGLEECLSDIKNNKIVQSKKVEAIGKTSLINKEEIVRRFNGELRKATDKINELVSEGTIIGVGSNTFASYYDMDHLFPKTEKETIDFSLPAFEFAPNTEHVAANEYKSEESFVIDVNKLFKNNFIDYKLRSLSREGNSLQIEAMILDKNSITHIANFTCDIVSEKLSNINKVNYNGNFLSLNEFNNYINNINVLAKDVNVNNKKLYDHMVYTKNNIKKTLAQLVSFSSIDNIIDSWLSLKLITPVNSEIFTSKKTFTELLNNINITKLSNSEISNILEYSKKFGSDLHIDRVGNERSYDLTEEEINEYSKKFGENLNFDRLNVKDSKVREIDNSITNENVLLKCEHYVSNYIKKYSSINCNLENNIVNYDIKIFNETLGINNVANLILEHDGRKIISCYTNYNGEKVNISNIEKMFESSEILKNHLTYHNGKKANSGIIISKNKLLQKLSSISNINSDNLESVITNWENNGKITRINSNEFTSKYTLEELLNSSNIKALSDEECLENLNKSKRNKFASIKSEQHDTKDTGIREINDHITLDNILTKCNQFIYQFIKEYKPLEFTPSATEANYLIEVFDKKAKINRELKLKLGYNDKKIINCNIEHDNKIVNLSQFDSLFLNEDDIQMIKENSKKFGNDIKIHREETEKQDFRILESKTKELSPKMLELKDKIRITINKAHNNKVITSNKYSHFISNLENVKSEKDLARMWKEFSNYIN